MNLYIRNPLHFLVSLWSYTLGYMIFFFNLGIKLQIIPLWRNCNIIFEVGVVNYFNAVIIQTLVHSVTSWSVKQWPTQFKVKWTIELLSENSVVKDFNRIDFRFKIVNGITKKEKKKKRVYWTILRFYILISEHRE